MPHSMDAHNSSSCYVFFRDACGGHALNVTDAAEPLEPGTHAFQLLEKCLSALSWEIES